MLQQMAQISDFYNRYFFLNLQIQLDKTKIMHYDMGICSFITRKEIIYETDRQPIPGSLSAPCYGSRCIGRRDQGGHLDLQFRIF